VGGGGVSISPLEEAVQGRGGGLIQPLQYCQTHQCGISEEKMEWLFKPMKQFVDNSHMYSRRKKTNDSDI
jgi:hypothetical protein